MNQGKAIAEEVTPQNIGSIISSKFSQENTKDFMNIIAQLMGVYGVVNLEKKTGISRVTLWRFMNGTRIPRIDSLQKILEALGIKVQFSFDERMLKFVEYMHSKQQWECELKKHSDSTKSIEHHAEQLKQEVSA